MKTAAILLLSIAVVCVAQRQGPNQQPGTGSDVKQLESVTWNLKDHKLIWTVQSGRMANGRFESRSSDRHEITPNDAVMMFDEQRRGFSHQEAVALQKLLDTLSLYCAESVIWWDHGEGKKLDSDGPGDGDKKEQPAPKKKVPVGADIALLR